MSELKISPYDLFSDSSKHLHLRINNMLYFCLKLSDANGNYLAFPAADNYIFNINHKKISTYNDSETFFIKKIAYDTYKGAIAVIKAYY